MPSTAWLIGLVTGALLAVAFLLASEPLAQDIIWQLLVSGAAVAVVVGIRLHRPSDPRPWHILGAGIGLFAVGSVADAAVWEHPPDGAVQAVVSLAFVVGYLTIGVASTRFVRAIAPDGDREGLIDGAIVMTGVTIVLWGAVFVGDAGGIAGSAAVRAENIVACLIPAWVMAMCVRVIFVTGYRKVSAVALLVAGTASLAGNVTSLLLESAGTYAPGHPMDLLWFATFTALAVCVLHPSMATMVQPAADVEYGLPLARLTVLGLSLLAAPVALRAAPEAPLISVTFLGSIVLSALVCWRFMRLVVELGQSRQELRLRADRQAAVGALGEAALSGEATEVLTHRALDIIWHHLPERLTVRLAATQSESTLQRSGGASAALRAALPDRTLAPDEADYVHAVANVLDVAALREQSESAMRHRSLHDPLTGLPNRDLLEDRLATALARAVRDDDAVALLFIDLDNFKCVNDTLGHAAGDRVLVEVAQRIGTAIGSGDTLTRFAGDEFVVLREDADAQSAWATAEDILFALVPPLYIDDNVIVTGASIGFALSPPGLTDPDELIRHADAAMYRAKQRGGGRCELFDSSLQEELLEHHALERALHGAIERGELRLAYQPIVRLAPSPVEDGSSLVTADELVGAEALLRWDHPERGAVPPSVFIPIAEANGLIASLGDFVLSEALHQLASWQQSVAADAPFTLLINLSPVQLADPRLYRRVRELLEETGADARRLGVEITESAMLDESETTIAMVLALRSLGINVALDDFGTGYSSLTHLRSVPLDLLKIDASFVQGVDSQRGDRAIVTAVVAMSRALDVTVLAEGIEDAEQLEAVRGLGCDLAQGFHLGRPMRPDALAARLPVTHSSRRAPA